MPGAGLTLQSELGLRPCLLPPTWSADPASPPSSAAVVSVVLARPAAAAVVAAVAGLARPAAAAAVAVAGLSRPAAAAVVVLARLAAAAVGAAYPRHLLPAPFRPGPLAVGHQQHHPPRGPTSLFDLNRFCDLTLFIFHTKSDCLRITPTAVLIVLQKCLLHQRPSCSNPPLGPLTARSARLCCEANTATAASSAVRNARARFPNKAVKTVTTTMA